MSKFADAISGAGSGFVAGASTGVPHAAGIGAVAGAIGGLFGSKPKKPKRQMDDVWHNSTLGHLDDASEDEIQELRKKLGGG